MGDRITLHRAITYSQELKLFNGAKLSPWIWYVYVEIKYENCFHKVWTAFCIFTTSIFTYCPGNNGRSYAKISNYINKAYYQTCILKIQKSILYNPQDTN